jgi:hypothetical protein
LGARHTGLSTLAAAFVAANLAEWADVWTAYWAACFLSARYAGFGACATALIAAHLIRCASVWTAHWAACFLGARHTGFGACTTAFIAAHLIRCASVRATDRTSCGCSYCFGAQDTHVAGVGANSHDGVAALLSRFASLVTTGWSSWWFYWAG